VSDLEQGSDEVAGDAPVAARALEWLGQKGLVEAMFARGKAADGHGRGAAFLLAAAFSGAAG
jgi:hypothetical protein